MLYQGARHRGLKQLQAPQSLQSHGMYRNGKANLLYRYRYVEPEESVDWRKAGVVGPIKNQHVNGSKCGCCWSFATIGVVESINALATGKMEVLSEQQLIACDKKGMTSAGNSIAALDISSTLIEFMVWHFHLTDAEQPCLLSKAPPAFMPLHVLTRMNLNPDHVLRSM